MGGERERNEGEKESGRFFPNSRNGGKRGGKEGAGNKLFEPRPLARKIQEDGGS